MMPIQPTMNLRIVERDEFSNTGEGGRLLPEDTVRIVVRQVLQQQWIYPFDGGAEEWRDVPIIKGPT